MNDIIKVLGIALFAMVIGGGIVTAAHVGSHGAAYMTPDGLAELKDGSLEIGKYSVWNDQDVHHHKTCIVNVGGVDYEITYKMTGSGGKIVGVSKVVPTPVENETEPQNDTPVVPTNDTPEVPENKTPVVPDDDTKVDPEPQNDTPVVPQNETPVENETEPVDPEVPENETPVVPVVPDNNTHGVVPHVSGDDVTLANGANATIENATANTDNGADENGIVMQKAGNPYFLLVIAVVLLIGAVAYSRRY